MRSFVLAALGALTVGGAIGAGCGGGGHSTGSGGNDGGNLGDSTVADGATVTEGGGNDGGSPESGGPHLAKLPVKNVVFFVKENRTFDVYFGKFPGANGATTGTTCNGQTIPLQPLLDRSSPDITHAWAAALESYNDGGMNCFDQITTAQYPSDGGPLGYQVADEQDIPNYWTLAKTFVLSDNFLLGPARAELPEPSLHNRRDQRRRHRQPARGRRHEPRRPEGRGLRFEHELPRSG